MATFNKMDMMNCCRGWHDFSDGASECLVCGAADDEASAPNATGLAKHHGIVPPPSASMVKAFEADSPNDTVDALVQAEAFVAGFEGDATQEGVADILAGLRAAIQREQAAPDMLAALKLATDTMSPARNSEEVAALGEIRAAIAKAEAAFVAPAPVTGPYHGPSLADQLRLIGSLAGTSDKRGHQDQRETVAYVESVTADMLAELKLLRLIVLKLIDAEYNITTWGLRERFKQINATIAKAEGRANV